MNQEEVKQLMMMIINQLGKRFLMHFPKFILKTIDVNGHQKEEIIGQDP